jgi:sec-independent protein translocase protein TatA
MPGSPVLLFLDISGGELLVIMLVVFMVFGPDKMPEMARKAGRMMNQMKKATSDLTREFKKETAGLEDEIKSAHSKVNEQLANVSREFNRTKAQVVTDMNTDDKPSSPNIAGSILNEPAAATEVSQEPAKPDETPTKSI